ncbi:related to pos5-mitochondrial nadh kinase [Ceraceosorus bombacis]|uniref:Related to pos5-mitochondrial nadh kinase n=1 Tax=Ceraceosorus bombacis TaxID=401625 RepID=A0A0P1BKL5_9BASI|nr:related to pos5-mitochondrial nadh kinase [Ceraceosorus bombacis]
MGLTRGVRTGTPFGSFQSCTLASGQSAGRISATQVTPGSWRRAGHLRLERPSQQRHDSLMAARCYGAGCRMMSSSTAAHGLERLPDKVQVRTGPIGRLSKVLEPRTSDHITTRVGSSFGGNHSLEWMHSPRNVLLVVKRGDQAANAAASKIAQYLKALHPESNLIVEDADVFAQMQNRFPKLLSFSPAEKPLLARKVDFIVTLGGDGTILHASSLFDDAPVPPVLSFSMGTLGFLLPFHIGAFEHALQELISGKASLLLRMRLQMSVHGPDGQELPRRSHKQQVHLMNEVALHRGREPHLTMIDAFVDGRHLTQAISDGLIIATPTGSTAYSLSAGGPIVHPSAQSLVLTPICPRSLSFRSVILPSDSTVQLKISKTSRSPAELTVDGQDLGVLSPGEYLQVAMSPYPIPCVNRSSATLGPHAAARSKEPTLLDDATESNGARRAQQEHRPLSSASHSEREDDDWVRDINTLLKFNASFGKGALENPLDDTAGAAMSK